ncbi:MAG: sarcosine oxidase subunit gamma family protein [Thalassobaculum sp.]|uniref:sarcosine oxidase subunit gamma n=1 Tax=Thalassobaculum sp. TaxID=2022740 RepID=UPI0032ECBF34
MAEAATPTPRSPLDGYTGPVGGPSDAGVVLGELRFQGKINLRGTADDKAFSEAVAKAVGLAPPATPGTVATAGDRAVLWLGPDEWLVLMPAGEETAVATALNAALAGMQASATDVTDNYTTVRIAGPKARWVLAKGWAVDLHPGVFGPGRVAQGNLALTNAILRQTTDDPPSFEILVRPSFAKYLWDWLTDAALEVGYRVEAG